MTVGTAIAPLKAAQLPAVPPELLAQFAENAGAGTESMTNADKAIPFIGLVQSLSPQRKKDNPKYIDGAEEGDIFNSVTRDLYKGPEGIFVIPVDYQRVYNAWIPRDEGGGFLGSYADKDLKQPLATSTRDDYDGSQQVVPTANHFVLVQANDGSWQPALLSMKSSQLTVSRKWNTVMSMTFVPGPGGKSVAAPTFAKVYRVRSVNAKNDKGEYYNYIVDEVGFVTPEQFAAALEFRTSLKAGRVQVDYTKDDTGPGTVDATVVEGEEKGDLPF